MDTSLPFSKKLPYQFQDLSLFANETYSEASRTLLDRPRFAVEDPSDQQTLAYVASASVAEYDEAIQKAHRALTTYGMLTPRARGQLLRSWSHQVQRSREDLAALCTLELGKVFQESLKAVDYATDCLAWFANLAEQGCRGETIPNSNAGGNVRIFTIRKPVGVVAAITPWNSPYSGVLKKIAPALAVGCTVVHKPAPETPLCAIALAKTCERAGFPSGVYNMLTSSSENAKKVGSLFCSHPLVRHITFTGSTSVGKSLAAQCGANMKKITMELGGNAPFIVFDDADLDAAVKGLIACKFSSAGQVCIYANRILVDNRVHEKFVDKLLDSMAEKVILGSPWDKRCTLGPLYAAKGAAKVQRLLEDALSKGARLATSGIYQEGSAFYPPSVLLDVKPGMKVTSEEIFGPLVAVSTFETEKEAIRLANDAETGLSGYVFTENLSRLMRVAEALEVGMVGARTGSISAIEQPFGGVKDSGLGREGSVHALEEYTDVKAITLAL